MSTTVEVASRFESSAWVVPELPKTYTEVALKAVADDETAKTEPVTHADSTAKLDSVAALVGSGRTACVHATDPDTALTATKPEILLVSQADTLASKADKDDSVARAETSTLSTFKLPDSFYNIFKYFKSRL